MSSIVVKEYRRKQNYLVERKLRLKQMAKVMEQDTVGEAIKKSSKSIAQIAEEMPCTTQALYYYIKGERSPSLAQFMRLCEVLGRSRDSIKVDVVKATKLGEAEDGEFMGMGE